jgi:hypothetical protein
VNNLPKSLLLVLGACCVAQTSALADGYMSVTTTSTDTPVVSAPIEVTRTTVETTPVLIQQPTVLVVPTTTSTTVIEKKKHHHHLIHVPFVSVF